VGCVKVSQLLKQVAMLKKEKNGGKIRHVYLLYY
jgi:hypothetical protein